MPAVEEAVVVEDRSAAVEAVEVEEVLLVEEEAVPEKDDVLEAVREVGVQEVGEVIVVKAVGEVIVVAERKEEAAA